MFPRGPVYSAGSPDDSRLLRDVLNHGGERGNGKGMSTKRAEVCLALAHKTKELDTRAALLEFAYEFRTVAKRLERDERKLMVRAASDGMPKHGV